MASTELGPWKWKRPKRKRIVYPTLQDAQAAAEFATERTGVAYFTLALPEGYVIHRVG